MKVKRDQCRLPLKTNIDVGGTQSLQDGPDSWYPVWRRLSFLSRGSFEVVFGTDCTFHLYIWSIHTSRGGKWYQTPSKPRINLTVTVTWVLVR